MKLKLFVKSLLCLSLGGIIPSVLAVGAMVVFHYNSFKFIVTMSIVVNIILLAWWVYQLREFRLSIPRIRNYYVYNLVAAGTYGALGTGGALVRHFLSGQAREMFSKAYTYLFFNFKSFHYYCYGSSFSMGHARSAFYYSVLLMLLVSVFPLFINKKKILKIPQDLKSHVNRNKF